MDKLQEFKKWYYENDNYDFYTSFDNVNVSEIYKLEIPFDTNGELPMCMDIFENLTELTVYGKSTKFPEVLYRFPKLKKVSFYYSVTRKFRSRLLEIQTLEQIGEHHESDSEND